jgi:hypothetical protein
MKAAFQGSYADLKFIKSRSVAQVVVELPIEEAAAFVAAFGAPVPGSECPVALARIHPEKDVSERDDRLSPEAMRRRRIMWGGSPEELLEYETEIKRELTPTPVNDSPKERRPWATLSYAEQAGIRCNEPTFWRWLECQRGVAINSSQIAASAVRAICQVGSRSELIRGTVAGKRWEFVCSACESWLPQEIAHV